MIDAMRGTNLDHVPLLNNQGYICGIMGQATWIATYRKDQSNSVTRIEERKVFGDGTAMWREKLGERDRCF